MLLDLMMDRMVGYPHKTARLHWGQRRPGDAGTLVPAVSQCSVAEGRKHHMATWELTAASHPTAAVASAT